VGFNGLDQIVFFPDEHITIEGASISLAVAMSKSDDQYSVIWSFVSEYSLLLDQGISTVFPKLQNAT
jgi:hypothetical protein